VAKKKKPIDLSKKNLEFTQNSIRYKIVLFRPENMTLDVMRFEGDKKLGISSLPFAHLPRELKKTIKPK
jgi:hypothetical protein